MYLATIQEIATTGTEDDLVNLLLAYGSSGTVKDGVALPKKCIDWIEDGVYEDEDKTRRDRKYSLLAEYVVDAKAFKENHALPKSIVQEFRDAQKESDKTITLLAEHVLRLSEEITRLSEEIAKHPASKPAAEETPEEEKKPQKPAKPYSKITGALVPKQP